MKRRFLWILLTFLTLSSYAQLPFYYKLKNVTGSLYTVDKKEVKVSFHSRNRLKISNCEDQNLIQFLSTLTLGKHGRKGLRHLLTTAAKITLVISDTIGISKINGKYYLMAAITGPSIYQSNAIIEDSDHRGLRVPYFLRKKRYSRVYAENTIEFFKGSFLYANDSISSLKDKPIKIIDLETSETTTNCSIDSIKIEPLTKPDYLYFNLKEFFYFAGIHEIFHTSSENLRLHMQGGDAEKEAMELEIKAFKGRRKINRKIPKAPILDE